MQSSSASNSVESYIQQFPTNIQVILQSVREVVKQAAPDAVESISYGMPGYKYKGKPVAYFGAFAHHIGFYATPYAHEEFEKRLSPYKQGKGSVQFPLDQPMPLDLIRDMVAFNYQNLGD